MDKKAEGNLEILKLLFKAGAGGVSALGILIGLYLNSFLWVFGFLVLSVLLGLFTSKSSFSACTVFVIGAIFFGLYANFEKTYGYGDMIWSILFAVIMIVIIVLKEQQQ